MTRTLIVMGVSGTGKSTVGQGLAKALGCTFTEGDDYHSQKSVAKMAAGVPLTDADRWPWLRELGALIGAREQAGQDAVLTCSALKHAYRQLLLDGHPSVFFVHVTVDEEVLKRRVEQRKNHFMPASLLASQLETLEPLRADEPGVAVAGEGSSESVIAAALAAVTRLAPEDR